MYCENCGNKLTNQDKYCPVCGTKNNPNSVNEVYREPIKFSMALSIIAICTFWCPIICMPCAIISIIKGKNNKNYKQVSMISAISIVLSIIFITLITLLLVATTSYINNSDLKRNYNTTEQTQEFDITNSTWKTTNNEVVNLYKNSNYIWYSTRNSKDSNYYSGTYEIYSGSAAVKYIANNLKQYNLTEDTQWENIKNSGHNLEDYYLIIFNCTTFNNNTLDENQAKVTPYYGFYDEAQKRLELTDITTKNSIVLNEANREDYTDSTNDV